MTAAIVVHQLLLFIHLLAFALAISELLRGDLWLLGCRRLDPVWLQRLSRRMLILLVLLWISGAALLLMSAGPDPALLLTNPKLAAKLFVVSALTLNGLLLHMIAFPMMLRGAGVAAVVACSLGAVSTGSWVYASFVGVSRIIAPVLTLPMYLGLYAAVIVSGIAIGLVFVRPRLQRVLNAGSSMAKLRPLGRSPMADALSPGGAAASRHPVTQRPVAGTIALGIGAVLLVVLLSGLPMGAGV